MKLGMFVSALLVPGVALGRLLPGVVPGSEMEAGMSNLFERESCKSNNCLRGITGENAKPAEAVRRADCSSFMRQTVVLPTTTIVNPQRRQNVVQNNIPTYAVTACSVASKYSSACSCWGVTATIVTIQPTTIVTIRSITTSTALDQSTSSFSVESTTTAAFDQSTSSSAVESTTTATLDQSTSSSAVESTTTATLDQSTSSSAVESTTTATLDQSTSSVKIPSIVTKTFVASRSSVQSSASPTSTTLTGILQVNTTGTFLGYLAPDPNYWTPLITTDAASALAVSFTVLIGATSATSVEFSAAGLQGGYPFLGFVSGRDSTSSDEAVGSFNYLYIDPTSHTAPGSIPLSVPNYFAASSGLNKQSESSIWNIDLSTGIVTPTWINTDGNPASNFQIFVQSNHLYAGSDPDAFHSRFPAPVTPAILIFISN